MNQYIDTDGVARCQVIAHQVSAEVERMIDSAVQVCHHPALADY